MSITGEQHIQAAEPWVVPVADERPVDGCRLMNNPSATMFEARLPGRYSTVQ